MASIYFVYEWIIDHIFKVWRHVIGSVINQDVSTYSTIFSAQYTISTYLATFSGGGAFSRNQIHVRNNICALIERRSSDAKTSLGKLPHGKYGKWIFWFLSFLIKINDMWLILSKHYNSKLPLYHWLENISYITTLAS